MERGGKDIYDINGEMTKKVNNIKWERMKGAGGEESDLL